MAQQTIAIAPVRLARAATRMLVPPLILLVTAGAGLAAGLLVGGLAGAGLLIAAAGLALLGGYLGLMLLTVRLDVEVAMLHLHWLGGRRRYTLNRGPVTRVRLVGEDRARLRARFGALGWGLGRATLRDEERIELVRLAPTPTLILVPTDRGRVAIAAADEDELIAALAAAARVQQRLEAVAARPAVAPAPLPVALPAPAPAYEPPRVLTGIERTQLELRLAAERAAALAAAEAERRVAAAEGAGGAVIAAPVSPVAAGRRRRAWRRPAWVARPARPAWRPTGPQAIGYVVAAFPLAVAGAAWVAAALLGGWPAGADDERPQVLALILAGPGGTLAVLMARAWFPRLTGLVVTTAILSAALLVRAASLG